MDTPLPQVIDPGEFVCLRIWIPNDRGYRQAVLGAVSYLGNWFAWERDAAHQGREAAAVFRQAYSLTVEDLLAGKNCGDTSDCDGSSSEPVTLDEINSCGGLIVLEAEDVGQVVTDVKWNALTGKLEVYYGHCCKEELDIGTLNSSPPANVYAPDVTDPPPAVDVSCQKAYHIANTLVEYMDYGYSQMPELIWVWAGNMRDGEYSRFSISDWSMFKMFEEFNALWQAQSVGWTNMWTSVDTKRLTCLLAPHLSDDTYELTREEYDAMKSAKSNTGNTVTELVLETTWDAFNFSNIALLCAEAASIDNIDCLCPDNTGLNLPTWYDSQEWGVILDFQAAQPAYTTLATSNGISTITPEGLALTEGTVGSDVVGFTDWAPPDVTGTVTRMKIEFLIADAWLAANSWTGLGLNIGGVGTNLQSELVGTSGIYVWEDETVSFQVNQVALSVEADYDSQFTPAFPIVARVILAGTGNHPFGL